nr:hypothetical protein [Tanacetum cinerariifolium]
TEPSEDPPSSDHPLIAPEVSIEDSTEAGTEAGIKATIEVTVKVAAEPVLPEHTVAERLEEHEENALKDRAETTETKRANLHDRVRKSMSIEARDAKFRREIQANEDAQGQLWRNHPFNLFV